jgi:hypothetical protein
VGTSNSGDFKPLTGGGKIARVRLGEVFEAVDSNAPARVAVGTAVGVLAASNPIVSAAVAGYQAAVLSSDAIDAGAKAYRQTDDPKAAIGAAGKVLAKGAVEAVAEQALGTAIDVGWTAAKSAAKVVTTTEQDRLITSAAKSTVEEGAREWLKKQRKS